MSKKEELRKIIDEVCLTNNLPIPITVISCGKLLREHLGKEQAIKLFSEVLEEILEKPDMDNPYAWAGYKTTIEFLKKND